MPVAGTKRHGAIIEISRDPVAIPFDLMGPFRPFGRLGHERWQARRDPRGQGLIEESGLARIRRFRNDRAADGAVSETVCLARARRWFAGRLGHASDGAEKMLRGRGRSIEV
jgi:hypothetical protein